MRSTTPPSQMSIGRLSSPSATILIVLLLACCVIWPIPGAFGVSPAPDGAYPGANTAEGQNALQSLSSGVWNTGLGYQALYHDTTGNFNSAEGMRALFSNTTGHHNTASGVQALYSNTTGNFNTANGVNTLYSNTTGSDNTATGHQALGLNTTGGDNTATGFKALASNTASGNTATGSQALFSNTTGIDNTANGSQALFHNTTGMDNTANGLSALLSNTTGYENTANGSLALSSNTTGHDNAANGYQALLFNTTGSQNTANGVGALGSNTTGVGNTANGVEALFGNTTGSYNIALGVDAGSNVTTGNGNIDIDSSGVPGESNTIRIGNGRGQQTATYIAGIYNVNEGGTILPVYINSNGRLGTQGLPSSRRFKKEIKPMGETSEAILSFQPVTFQYKSGKTSRPEFGLIAEDVAEINPDLVVRDKNGEIYTVRYDAVNAMLLNEFLKEHKKVEELQSTVAKQEATAALQQGEIQTLTASLKEEAALIQKVSAQLALKERASQTVFNNQ